MLDTFGHIILDLLKSTFSSVELTTLTFHPLHKLMTSHIEEEAIERLLKWPDQSSNGNNKLHLFASQPTLSFPLGETFCHPFSPYDAGGAAPNRWPATTSGPASFHSPPSPSPIYLRSALQSVARPVQLPESSYMEGAA